jgi:tetratricopeptide (TPR) repeat protein
MRNNLIVITVSFLLGITAGASILFSKKGDADFAPISNKVALMWRMQALQRELMGGNNDPQIQDWAIADAELYLRIDEHRSIDSLDEVYVGCFLGHLYCQTGRVEDGLALQQRALTCVQRLSIRDGLMRDDDVYLMASLFRDVGQYLEMNGADEEALTSYIFAMDLAGSRLLSRSDPQLLRAYTNAYDAWVNVALDDNTLRVPDLSAQDRLSMAIRVAQAVYQRSPDSSVHRFVLAMCHLNHARFLFRLDDPQQAAEQYELAREIVDQHSKSPALSELVGSGQIYAMGIAIYERLDNQNLADRARRGLSTTCQQLTEGDRFNSTEAGEAMSLIHHVLRVYGGLETSPREPSSTDATRNAEPKKTMTHATTA